ncbi:PrsW family glutamic-type intramembrane protease [Geoglobus acetivorans]|uniref:PrsW family glutamic-type intramembrane protease n=1 Tax=Geoglobus acetivorans TaxID=565033 RepID=A0ABZ3H3B0_GEOAI|nr:PrsW family intramembrane metalloprotease [Geoglobus acetivorans]
MDITTIAILSYAPALFLLWYVYSKDRIESEPKRYVVAVFLASSTVSTTLALLLEQITPAILTFYLAPFIEEFTKFLALLIPYWKKQMDGVMDGVVYGVAAGLGFASFENLMYGLSFGQDVALTRAFLTPVAHSTFTAITGVGLGLKAEGKTSSVLPYLITGSFFHLWWNFSALNGLWVIPMLITNAFVLYSLIKLGMKEDIEKIEYYLLRKI